MKRSLRAIVVWLSIAMLISSADVATAGPFRDFFERYVAQSRTRMRRRDRTGAVGALISIMRLHRAMLRILKLRPAQSLRLQVDLMCAWQRQPQAPISKKLICSMELPSPENQA